MLFHHSDLCTELEVCVPSRCVVLVCENVFQITRKCFRVFAEPTQWLFMKVRRMDGQSAQEQRHDDSKSGGRVVLVTAHTLVREALNRVLHRPLVTIVEDFVGVAPVAVWSLVLRPEQLIADPTRGLVFVLDGAGGLDAYRHDRSIALTYHSLRPSRFALSTKTGNLAVVQDRESGCMVLVFVEADCVRSCSFTRVMVHFCVCFCPLSRAQSAHFHSLIQFEPVWWLYPSRNTKIKMSSTLLVSTVLWLRLRVTARLCALFSSVPASTCKT